MRFWNIMKQSIHCQKWSQEVLWEVCDVSVRWVGPEVSGGGAEGGARRLDRHTGTLDRPSAQHALVWAQSDRDPHPGRGWQVRARLLELQLRLAHCSAGYLDVCVCVCGSGCWTSTSRSRWRRSSGCAPIRDRPCCSQPPWVKRWCFPSALLHLIPLQWMLHVSSDEIRLLCK